jgi:hypothetical protein
VIVVRRHVAGSERAGGDPVEHDARQHGRGDHGHGLPYQPRFAELLDRQQCEHDGGRESEAGERGGKRRQTPAAVGLPNV